jgi:D-tagatose-1,6-bisphosphate aldolase subunit GatZ/KbaZ
LGFTENFAGDSMSTLPQYDLKSLAEARAQGRFPGIYSVCSAHPWVIEASMCRAIAEEGPLLIEATCNQVNQFGGYTGMTPQAFRDYVLSIASQIGFPQERLLLGGDHLGPHPWRHLPAEEAMRNASNLVAAFVEAGFLKIHLDTSMSCAGDPVPLPDNVIAQRAAMLAKTAESKAGHNRLRYIIGTEVPTPGGSVEELAVSVTKREAAELALTLHHQAFVAEGAEQAWNKVVALVVQPGVEFGHEDVVDYQPEKSKNLCALLITHPALVFEAHSTDYQRPRAYSDLVHDGFAILKVGPALTYAMRQALYALEAIEQVLIPEAQCSHLSAVMERLMIEHPEDWQHHYHGDSQTLRRLRVHSYSDRIRYYWNRPEATAAVAKLVENLNSTEIPETLLSDYLPAQYEQVKDGLLKKDVVSLILAKITEALEPYVEACRQS